MAVLLGLALGVAALPAGGAPKTPESSSLSGWEERRLASGRAVWLRQLFDRNELRATVFSGGLVLSLARSGHLLQLDAASLRLLGTRTFDPPLAALGGEGGSVWAVDAEGRVLRVNPSDLTTREVARVTGLPRFVGVPAGHPDDRLPLVVTQTPYDKEHHLLVWRPPYRSALQLAGRAVHGGQASSFFVDGAGTLWLGHDHGEFGGALESLPESARVPQERAHVPGGVDGIGPGRGDKVLAWGGYSHVSSSGFVFEAGAGGDRVLYEGGVEEGAVVPVDRPSGPVLAAAVVEPNGLLVVTRDGVFESAAEPWTWQRRADMPPIERRLDPEWGYENTPVRSALRLDRGRVLVTTAMNGLVEIAGSRVTERALPMQAPRGRVTRIVATRDGTVLARENVLEPVRWRGEAWEPIPIWPADVEPDRIDSLYHLVPAVVDGKVTLLVATSVRKVSDLTRWVDGRSSLLHHLAADGGFFAADIFATPRGTLWAASTSLFRFDKGAVRAVGKVAGPRPDERADSRLRVIDRPGRMDPPWLLLSDYEGTFFRLDPVGAGAGPVLTRVGAPPARGRDALRVSDAAMLPSGAVLVATSQGMRLLDVERGALRPAEGPFEELSVSHFTRDGLGRLWMAGEGLWLADGAEQQVQAIDAFPLLARRSHALGPDAEHKDGVLVAFDDDTLVMVRAAP